MKFEDFFKIFYTKNEYYEEYDNNDCYYDNLHHDTHYYKGYLVHREDGPAKEYSYGSKFWYKDGKPHREDGPACEYNDGTKFWYLNGIEYSEDEYNRIINIKKKGRILNEI